MEKNKSKRWSDLTVPVNPEYDWSQDPTSQASYFNPVTLCNKEVQYANAAIEVVGSLMGLTRKVGELKVQLKRLRLEKEDMEAAVISAEEPAKKDVGNLTLLNAFVRGKLLASDQANVYLETIRNIRATEEALQKTETELDSGHRALDAIKMVSQNLQTALSYYKAEMRMTS